MTAQAGGRAGLAVLQGWRQDAGTPTDIRGTSPIKISPVSAVDDLGGGAQKHAHRQHRALAHITPSATSERAPMKQSSSTMTGSALQRLSTPPIRTAAGMCTRLPICAQDPTVAQVRSWSPHRHRRRD